MSQIAKFHAVVIENLPKLPSDVVQNWIQNPKAVAKVLAAFAPPVVVSSADEVMAAVKDDPARTKRIITRVPFDPSMIGQNWTFWKGPIDGNGLEGEELDCDQRSLILSEIDFAQVSRETCLVEKEKPISGEEKLRHLIESGKIRLDPSFGWALVNEPGQKTLRWLYDTFGVDHLDFLGRVLRRPGGRRRVLYLYRYDCGRWRWSVYRLDHDGDVGRVSAALPAPSSSSDLVTVS